MKKFFALLISGVLLASSVPNGVGYAAETKAVTPTKTAIASKEILPKEVEGTKEPTDETLKSAITSVKAKITIPTEYSEFNYSFFNTNSYADSYWSLTWTNPKDQSNIMVNCDQNNHITYYNVNNNNQKQNSIPVYRKQELKQKAEDFIKLIAPDIALKLKYINTDFDGVYNSNYIYNYQRLENGICLPENTVSVAVNSINGEVNSANIQWLYDVAVPAADIKISKEEATKLIKKNMEMKLSYHTNDYRIYSSSLINSNDKKALLFYEPNQTYISVDAKTGKVYLSKNEWVNEKNDLATAKKESTAGSTNTVTRDAAALTQEELIKLDELKSLITKGNAIKAITGNKYLYLDKNLTSSSASLSKSYYNKGKSTGYVWNIQLNDPREISKKKNADNYRAYASAQVDAKTGKILSFNASMKSQYNEKTGKWNTVKIKYHKNECQVSLEKFLKNQMASHFALTKLSETNKDYIAYYKANNDPVYGGFNYRYNRINEGVEYPFNILYGAVDGVTGKIYSFYCNWDEDVIFESKNGAITSDQAMDYYLGKEGYQLIYEINVINKLEKQGNFISNTDAHKVDYEIRLVYNPEINPSFISPFTGEQLNYNGEVYKKETTYQYLDVAETPENKEILLLADMNIGFEGQYFYPKNEITSGELSELMKKVGYGYNVADNTNKENKITREEIAKSFIEQLGLKNAATIKGIYKTGFADEQSIGEDYIGAVALAKGLNLMQGDKNNMFNPKSYITRAEAVHLILNFIRSQQSRIYEY